MDTIRCGIVALALLATGVAHAEVKQAAADGFHIHHSATLRSTPAEAWTALVKPQAWWSSEHTWSGKAAHLRFDAKAGGCWCEQWPGGSAEHGRVVMALPGELLRLEAALGPLQEHALQAVLTYRIDKTADGGSTLDLDYRVNGSSASGLDAFAPPVDGVLAAQLARLQRYLESGDPEPPPAPPPVPHGTAEAARRAAIIEEWRRSAEEEAARPKDDRTPPAQPPKPR
jgi:uncharacterized protein YndB with AHSA1/START domain